MNRCGLASYPTQALALRRISFPFAVCSSPRPMRALRCIQLPFFSRSEPRLYDQFGAQKRGPSKAQPLAAISAMTDDDVE